MSDMFDKVTSQQDIIKKLLSKIPGFSGYIERENRRSSDKILRDTIASRFEDDLEKNFRTTKRSDHDRERSSSIDDLEAAAIKLRQVIDRVKKASYGYSGFFDAVKINEKELANIYEYDLAMLDQVDVADKAVDTVETSIGTDGLPAAIRNLVSIADQCVVTFDKRAEVITGMNSSS